MKNKPSTRFEKMLKLSVQPFQSKEEKQEQVKSDDYISKKTHQHMPASTSEKQRDTSR